MGSPPTVKPKAIYSVQATYSLHVTPKNVITCDEIISLPLAYGVERFTKIDNVFHNVYPVVEIVSPVEDFVFDIYTNESVLVEPICISSESSDINSYRASRLFFFLPSNTTGIKKVVVKSKPSWYKVDLLFGIMPPPYNYENMQLSLIVGRVRYLESRVNGVEDETQTLNDRVDALENKTDNLKVVTHALKTSYPRKELPKASGKQTINIEKGMLYFWTQYTYTSGSSKGFMTKITVSDGVTPTACTLTLDESQCVMIDLLACTITAFNAKTGKISQQLKIYPTIVGYKTIEFEDFDDIASNTLTVLITGRGVE